MDSYAVEVIYTHDHWLVLSEKRAKGLKIIDVLSVCGFGDSILHGSVARGDVTKDSDVDIAFLRPLSVGMVRACLEDRGFNVYDIRVVQPTPRHTPKVYIYLDPFEEQSVSIPLAELEPIEVEYYKFSGFVTRDDILANKRSKGVNKKLMLIVPTERGHIEMPVVGNEGYVSRVLGVPLEVVKDRVAALSRRVEEGHTGLFIDVSVPLFEELEHFIQRLCRENPYFRRAVARHGLCT